MANDWLSAIAESDLMNETSAYLSRGRRFEELTEEVLKRKWIEAFRGWLIGGDESAKLVDSDLLAEMTFKSRHQTQVDVVLRGYNQAGQTLLALIEVYEDP